MQMIRIVMLVLLASFLCGEATAQNEKGKRKRQTRDSQQQRRSLVDAIKRLDTNGDKSLTADEIPERLAQRFARLDLNENGVIDATEIERALETIDRRQIRNGNRKGNRGGEGNSKRDRMQGGKRNENRDRKKRQQANDAGDSQLNATGLLRRFDKDDDNMISLEEAPERIKAAFKRIDANADDLLDESELAQMVNSLAKRMRPDDQNPEKSKRKKRRRDDQGETSRKGVKPKHPGSGK